MSSIFREQYDFQVINVRQDLVFSAVFLDFDVFNFVGYFMGFMKITILFHLTYFSSLVPIQSYFFARIVCSTYGYFEVIIEKTESTSGSYNLLYSIR